ncbi:hypothetical protein SAMN05444170_5746 [Bradyrhizobium erythrophlei]|jgi:hypothetical protein|uniref:Uncharacterized protein n=1 Tax=Bradyrhizobium erythrophlei TaxID=1437360 RepID=A0A1M7ULV5_9BRAD|nr:hypothetical protein SAMN05444170_5746 [Bradyrhizobium erythrophlei]
MSTETAQRQTDVIKSRRFTNGQLIRFLLKGLPVATTDKTQNLYNRTLHFRRRLIELRTDSVCASA